MSHALFPKSFLGFEALGVTDLHQKREKINKEKYKSCFVKCSELKVGKFCMVLAEQWFSTFLNVKINLIA